MSFFASKPNGNNNGSPQTVDINSLVETSERNFISQAELTKLGGIEVNANKTTLVDNLTSTSTATALTANQGRALNAVITTHSGDAIKHITAAERTAWNAKSNFSGSYDDLTNKPTIPTATTVVNNLTSTVTTSALSSAQGKVLNDKIVALKINESQYEVEVDTEGTTSITVPKANYNVNNVMLVFNGESKVAKSKYTVTNTASEVTITFTGVLTVGDVIEVIFLNV